MNAMKNKIKSQRGASITFALLIFLVCAVVSIVVVVAGSAAAGRMSQRAETDQRYYAVTSAVELLCDDFKGMKVTVEYSTEAGTNPKADDFEVTGIVDSNNVPRTNLNDPELVMVTAVSRKLAMLLAGLGLDDEQYTLTVSSNPEKTTLDCDINEYIKNDGRVIFEVSNHRDKKAVNQKIYTLQAVFDATISQSTSQYTDTTENKTMEQITTTLVWSVNSLAKGTVTAS